MAAITITSRVVNLILTSHCANRIWETLPSSFFRYGKTHCEPLERLHFPEVNVFRSELESLLNRLAQTANEFFEERRGLELSSHYWGGSDKVAELVKGIESYNHVFSAPSQEDIFTWCEEGQERYKKEIPPGFKDAKSKDGVRKYGDLIIWKELLNFARTQSKDIVFITDDVKADWWESENEKRIFHHKLVAEFEKTGRTIIVSLTLRSCRMRSRRWRIPSLICITSQRPLLISYWTWLSWHPK